MKRRFFYRQIGLWLPLLLLAFRSGGQENHMVGNMSMDTARVSLLLKQSNRLREISATDSALGLLREALQISRAGHYEAGIAGALLCIAFCYQDKGDYNKSKELLYRAYPHCIEAGKKQTRILLSLYNGLGGTYLLLGENDSALHFFYKALEAVQKSPNIDSFMLTQIYSNLGTTWMQKRTLAKGLMYQEKAAAMAAALKDSLFLANTYSSMGTSYLAQKDTARSLQYLNAALSIYRKKQNLHGQQYVYYSLADAQPDQQKAIALYKNALHIDSTTAFTAAIYQGIGKAYYLMGNYHEAAVWYHKSETVCLQQHLFTHRLANYSALSSIYEHLGDYKSAFRYQVAYADLNDSLLNREKEETVNTLDIRYRTAEKDKTIAQSKIQLYRQRQWFTGIAAGSLLLCSIVLGLYVITRQKQKLQAARLNSLEQQQKIERLHAKMQGEEEERSRIARELHDGVNVLLSATKMNYAALGKEYRGLPEAPAYGEVMSLLNEMGLELRTITYKLVPELLIQQSLPDAVETFCELIRKGNNLYIEFQSWGSFTALPAEYCFTIYRIVQELVHNVIKHAHATSALIQLRCQDGLLCLTVEDNGNGFDLEKPRKGLGLQSIHSRVNDLGGQVTFSSRPGEGTSVEVEIGTGIPDTSTT